MLRFKLGVVVLSLFLSASVFSKTQNITQDLALIPAVEVCDIMLNWVEKEIDGTFNKDSLGYVSAYNSRILFCPKPGRIASNSIINNSSVM